MKKKNICIIILISLIVLATTTISLIIFMPRKYYIPECAFEIFNETAEDMEQHFKERAQYYDYTDVYADKDGNLVFVVTREEREFFLDLFEDALSFYESYYIEDGLYIEYNENYTEITAKCKREDFGENITELLMEQIIFDVSCYQGFLGVKPEDNKVSLQVIDIDTNEVIYEKSVGAQ